MIVIVLPRLGTMPRQTCRKRPEQTLVGTRFQPQKRCVGTVHFQHRSRSHDFTRLCASVKPYRQDSGEQRQPSSRCGHGGRRTSAGAAE